MLALQRPAPPRPAPPHPPPLARSPTAQVCNCDCLPIIPLDASPHCAACAGGQGLGEDEAMSELISRDSMDSVRSEQLAAPRPL